MHVEHSRALTWGCWSPAETTFANFVPTPGFDEFDLADKDLAPTLLDFEEELNLEPGRL